MSLELAMYARNGGHLEEAGKRARLALDTFVRIYGESSSQAAGAANTLATVAQARGDYDEARALFEQSLAIKRAVYGGESARVAGAEYNLGLLLLLRLGAPPQAEPHLRRAVEIGSRTLPPAHSSLANFRLGHGSALRDLGRLDEARTVLALALQTFEQIAAPRGIDVALSRSEIACTVEPGDPRFDIARSEIEHAMVVLREHAADDPQSERIFRCAARSR
jgi:tetratricopeptide (TPR) repeat protein